MNPLARWLASLSFRQCLLFAVLAVIVLMYVNFMVSGLLAEIGLGSPSIMTASGDRFGDLVKVSLSYVDVTHDIGGTAAYKTWDLVYKRYFEHNDYAGVTGLQSGKLTHFHLPPLSTLLFLGAARIMVLAGAVAPLLWIAQALYLAVMLAVFYAGLREQRRNGPLWMAFVFLCLFSYPALAVLIRANFTGGLSVLLLFYFIFSLATRRHVGWLEVLAIALAVNIRPNALIFLLLLPWILGWRRSLLPAIKVVVVSSLVFAASLAWAHGIYPAYTLPNFLRGLALYNHYYIDANVDSNGNSSLFSIFANLSVLAGHGNPVLAGSLLALLTLPIAWAKTNLKRWFVTGPLALLTFFCAAICFGYSSHTLPVAEFFCFLLMIPALWGLLHHPMRELAAPFFVVSLYCLATPVFAPYHLLIFAAPLLLCCIRLEEWRCHPRLFAIVFLGSITMLAPKNYTFAGLGTPQCVLNPLWLFVLVCAFSAELIFPAGGVFPKPQSSAAGQEVAGQA